MWQHLAYALFCGQSSITHAALENVHLTAEDAEAIASVLTSSDPIQELLGASASATVKLNEGTRLQLLLMTEDDEIPDESAHWQLATDVEQVLVLESATLADQDVARVLVPGYGLCEVARSQLVATDGGNSLSETSRGVTSLELNFAFEPYAEDGLGRLLEVIGASLTQLHFCRDVAIVLRSCPNLETLTIDVTSIDAEAFVRAYRGSTSRLVELNCHFDDDLSVVMSELADSESKLARTLKHMSCQLNSRWGIEEHAASVATMLSVNRTLEFFYVRMQEKLSNPHLDTIKHFHDQVLPAPRAPLSLECRLAFLSIFTASRRGFELAAKRAKVAPLLSVLATFPMDRNVLSIIFGFAADNARRRVYVDTW